MIPTATDEVGPVFRHLFKWIQDRWFRFRVSRARIDENQQCPGCGYRRGKIRMDHEAGKIKHQCFVCFAIWSEPPILDPAEWILPPDPVHGSAVPVVPPAR